MKVRDLSQARSPCVPHDTFVDIANACVELGVQEQDIYGDFTLTSDKSWLRSFEKELAAYFDMEDALFLPSGTMAQSIVLKVAEAKSVCNSSTFVCHHSSHLLLHEQNSFEKLLSMNPRYKERGSETILEPTRAADFIPLIAECSPACTIVECPHREIGGKCSSWEDLRAISEACRERNVHFHMDGARLWEATAFYRHLDSEKDPLTVKETIQCISKLFDSIYVSFYKGLGGLTGAMLLGRSSFVQECRIWLRRFGGNVFSLMPYAVSSWISFRRNVDVFPTRHQRLCEVVFAIQHALKLEQNAHLQSLIRFDPEIPQVSLIHIYFQASQEECYHARQLMIEKSDSCVPFSRIRGTVGSQCYMELNMGPLNAGYFNDQWVDGYLQFLAVLSTLRRL